MTLSLLTLFAFLAGTPAAPTLSARPCSLEGDREFDAGNFKPALWHYRRAWRWEKTLSCQLKIALSLYHLGRFKAAMRHTESFIAAHAGASLLRRDPAYISARRLRLELLGRLRLPPGERPTHGRPPRTAYGPPLRARHRPVTSTPAPRRDTLKAPPPGYVPVTFVTVTLDRTLDTHRGQALRLEYSRRLLKGLFFHADLGSEHSPSISLGEGSARLEVAFGRLLLGGLLGVYHTTATQPVRRETNSVASQTTSAQLGLVLGLGARDHLFVAFTPLIDVAAGRLAGAVLSGGAPLLGGRFTVSWTSMRRVIIRNENLYEVKAYEAVLSVEIPLSRNTRGLRRAVVLRAGVSNRNEDPALTRPDVFVGTGLSVRW